MFGVYIVIESDEKVRIQTLCRTPLVCAVISRCCQPLKRENDTHA